MMYYGMNGHGLGMGWILGWGWIIDLIILALIIWLVIKVVNQGSLSDRAPGRTALDILKERYARGEIDRQEFEERKKGIQAP
jgi:putative membrane protein